MIFEEEKFLSFAGKEVFIKRIVPKNNDQSDPYLIFMHEGLGSSAQWKDFPSKIASECSVNVLLYDRLGYGKSGNISSKRKLDYLNREAEFLSILIKKLSLKEYCLLGHSEGGSIALIYASKHPEGLKKVITLSANTKVEDKMIPSIQEVMRSYEQQGSKLKQALMKYHGGKTDDVFYRWSKTWTAPFFSSWNIRQNLTQIQVPVLAIHGDDDVYTSMIQIKQIADCIPTSERVILKKCSHHPHFDYPEKVTALICDFLKKN